MRGKLTILTAIVSLLLCATNLSVAFIFALMWSRDNVKVCEDILWVRIAELCMALGISLLGIGVFIYTAYILQEDRLERLRK